MSNYEMHITLAIIFAIFSILTLFMGTVIYISFIAAAATIFTTVMAVFEQED